MRRSCWTMGPSDISLLTTNFSGKWRNLRRNAVAMLFLAFAFAEFPSSRATDVSLAWNPNSESDLAGYFIYYGPTNTPVQRADAGLATSLTLRNLSPGTTYRFYATAYNTAGLESDPSQQIVYTVSDNINPQGSNNGPSIVGLVDDPGGQKIQFSTHAGETYAVEATDTFPLGPWQTLASGLSGNGAILSIIDNTAANSTNRIYHVKTTPSSGQSVTSAPAGFQRLNLLGNSDTLVSIPFVRPPAALAQVASFSGPTIQVSGTPGWTANQWVYASGSQSNTYFVLISSGAREGDYFTITNSGTSSLTVDLEGGNLTGLATSDAISIVPYWTLGTIFPAGQGIYSSPAPANRYTEILIPNLSGTGINLSATTTYYYMGGKWLAVGQGTTSKNDDVILPDMFFWVRHNVTTATQLVARGAVVGTTWRLPIRRNASGSQDNCIALPRPAAVSLNNSWLFQSGAFRASPSAGSRLDELLVFDNTTLVKNKSAAATYYYWNGAWRKVGSTSDVGADLVFTPGSGVILRAGSGSSVTWTNQPAY